jgi:WD40 repeat protein/predicted Ser/Thr protein kinase
VLDAFERAWRCGVRPALAAYLPAGDGCAALLAELIHTDLEYRLKAGEPARVETYLADYPQLQRDRGVAIGLILAEYEFRRRQEADLTPQTYLERFPAYRQELARRLSDSLTLSARGAERPDLLRPEQQGVLSDSSPTVIWTGPSVTPQRPEGGPLRSAADLPTINGYEVLGELGRGGMGVVYLARQVQLNRLVALKMVLAGVHAEPKELVRFLAEAEAAARLQHPHIVRIYELGQQGGRPYFTMEFIEGASLAQRLAGTPLPAGEAARLVETLARAIHFAHARGIVHRDLKPANVLLAADGTPKISDFGLAKRLGVEGLTQTGSVLGTPSYMAPEQAGGKTAAVGPLSDVYALGALLYEALTGRPPFKAETPLATVQQVLAEEPVPPGRLQPRLPRDLETVCLKCLHKDPKKRYASALDLADDLGRFVAGESVRARPAPAWERGVKWARRRPAAAALMAVSLLALAAVAGGAAGFTAYLRHALEQRTQELLAEQQGHEREAEERQRERERAALDRQRQVGRDLYLSEARGAFQLGRAAEVCQARDLLARYQGRGPDDDWRGFEWQYLWRQCDRERQTFSGRQGRVNAGAFSPDGKLLAAAGADGTVQVWHVVTGQSRGTLTGHAGPVNGVAFSPDGLTLASAGVDGKVRLWDVASGKERLTLVHQQPLLSVAFSPDGAWVAAGGVLKAGRSWNLRTREERVLGTEARRLAFSPDGRTLAAALDIGLVQLWDWQTGQERAHTARRPVRRPEGTLPVAYAHDGRTLASADSAGAVLLWDAATARPLGSLPGHTGAVHSVAFSPDDQALVSAGDDATVRVWDLATRRVRAMFRGHAGAVLWADFSPDGRTVASAGADGAVKFWDVSVLPGPEPLPIPLWPAGPVAFSPDGRTLAAADRDRTVKLLDLASGRVTARLREHSGDVRALAFSPDGGTLASAGDDWTVLLWDAAAGRPRASLPGHLGPVAALAFSPDGTLLASGGADRLVKLWDLPAGRERATLKEHTDEVSSLAFAPDGKTLATAGADRNVFLWDVATAAVRARLPHHDGVLSVAFTDAGRRLIACAADGTFWNWDVARGQRLGDFLGLSTPMHRVAVSPDGWVIAGIEVSGVGHLWDARSRALRESFPAVAAGGHLPYYLAFSPDGKQLATAQPGRLWLWDLATWRVRQPPGQPPSPIHSLAFTPDGKTLLSAGTDSSIRVRHPLPFGVPGYAEDVARGGTENAVRLWDVSTGRQAGTLPTGHEVDLYSLAVSPDGRTAAAGGQGGTVWLWDRVTGEARPPFFISDRARRYWELVHPVGVLQAVPMSPVFHEYVASVAFSPGGKVLATASEENADEPSASDRHSAQSEWWTVKLWDPAAGRELLTLPGKQRLLSCLAFSPDGQTLVTNHGEEVRLWDVPTGQLRQTLTGHGGVVRCAAFSPDGALLATGGTDLRIRLWDLRGGPERPPLLGHTDVVTSLAFAPDGQTLASGSWDGKINLWSVAGAQPVGALEGHSGKVLCVAFSPDGRTLASGGDSALGVGEVYLWRAAARDRTEPAGGVARQGE